MHEKDFEGWNDVKQRTDKLARTTEFKEREIWWCSIGVNIGHEIDGKNKLFNRPVLVVKKFNHRLFWGVALSTQIKDNKNYFPISLHGKEQCVVLSHLRLYDSQRLHSDPLGTLSNKQFLAVKSALIKLLQ